MVAAKDVSMEPTIRSLNDDLVCGRQERSTNDGGKTTKQVLVSALRENCI